MINYRTEYNLDTTNQIYLDYSTITEEEILKHSPWIEGKKSDYKSIQKEIWSERQMNYRHIWEMLFGTGAIPRPATVKQVQKSGIDYVVRSVPDNRNVAIDLKCSIGDYRDPETNKYKVTIELYQNGKKTFTKDKRTDYVVYVIGNTNTMQLHFVVIPYQKMLQIIEDADPATCITSYNGSGLFFRISEDELIETYNCVVIKMRY